MDPESSRRRSSILEVMVVDEQGRVHVAEKVPGLSENDALYARETCSNFKVPWMDRCSVAPTHVASEGKGAYTNKGALVQQFLMNPRHFFNNNDMKFYIANFVEKQNEEAPVLCADEGFQPTILPDNEETDQTWTDTADDIQPTIVSDNEVTDRTWTDTADDIQPTIVSDNEETERTWTDPVSQNHPEPEGKCVRPARTVRTTMPTASNVSFQSYPVYRKRKVPWTSEEEKKLKEEVTNFYDSKKTGRKVIPWKQILESGAGVFDPSRTAENLKDKWRNILKQGG